MTQREARNGTLIVGGGYAGSILARHVGEATIVSPENFMLFRPLLAEAASATLEPRHVVVPLRMMCPRSELVVGSATALDEGARTVTVESHAGTFEVHYDRLVLALGSVARTLPVPGLAEHALGFNDLADAIALRNHVLAELEAADLAPGTPHLSFVFVGAGYAGVEALAELHDLVRDALRFYPRLRAAPQRWVLVEASDRILHELSPSLAAYVSKLLARRGIEVRTGDAARAARRGVGDALRRRADRDPHARVDDRRACASAARGLGAPGRRAGPRQGRRAAAGRGQGRDVGGRGLRPRRRTAPPARRTRRPASTPSARHASSRRTSAARRARTPTG